MRLALLLLLSAGCLEQTDTGGPWQDATTIGGALAIDVGPTPAAVPTCTLRVVSWNVQFGEDPDGLAAGIRASSELASADVILVQEIEAFSTESATRAARLADALGMTWIYTPAREKDSGTHGLATLSRHALMRPQRRELPYFDQARRPHRHIATTVDIELAETTVTIANVHLDVRLGAVDRVRQLDPAVAELPSRSILAGDFNTGPWAWFEGLVPLIPTEAIVGQDQATIIDDYLAANSFLPSLPTTAGTLRVPVVEIRIDNIYARSGLLRAGVAHVEGSDHWPIWADIDVCAGE